MEKRDWRPFVYGGLSSIVAEFGTFPIDTVKTRLQTIKYKDRYNGMINCFIQVKKQEGLKALYSGIWPAVLRQAVYGTIKFGSYYTLKSFICSKLASDPRYKDNLNTENSWINIGCATFAGAFSSAIANPTDVLKVRMQVHGRGTDKLGLFKCFYEIYANEGIRGLWRGVGPTSQRAAIIAAVELPVYDFCKHYLLDTIGDHVFNHFISSFIASLGSAIASTPVDVIRTRLMNQKRLIHPNPNSNLKPAKLYFSNSIECAIYTVKNEGLLALYKGFIPTWIRMGPWNIIFFITYEQLKKF